MLRYMMPAKSLFHAVGLVSTPHFRVKHHYIRTQGTPVDLLLHEYTYLYNQQTDCLTLFSLTNGDLVVEACFETTHTGERTTHNRGYPYIRMPQAEEQLSWSYQPYEDVLVNCTSRVEQQKLGGIYYEVLTVARRVMSNQSTSTSTEHYIAGMGLQGQWPPTNSFSGIRLSKTDHFLN